MNEYSELKSQLEALCCGQKKSFCHTMDRRRYKILCANFYSNPENRNTSICIAEEMAHLFLESEEEFLHWLDLE